MGLHEEHLQQFIAKGLERLEKRTFKRCRKLDHREEEDFHEARKSVKAWLGAVGFLPEGAMPVDPGFHLLAEILGDENDLATLSAWLKGHGFTQRFSPDLWKTIRDARKRLQKEAIRNAEMLTPSWAG